MRRLLLRLVIVSLPAWASNPGEPMDCSDWVFVEPGLSGTTEIAHPCKIEGTNEIQSVVAGARCRTV